MSAKQLQGAWVITELEVDGATLPACGRIIINGSDFTTADMGADYSGTISVTPKHLDLHFTTGPERGRTALGIYELKGDTLRFCLTITASVRPTQFATQEGSGLALETLRRDNHFEAPAAPVAIPTTLEPAPELEGDWEMLSCAMGGKALPADYVKTGRRTAAKNEFRVTVQGQTILHGHFATDVKNPGQIDYYLRGPKNAVHLQHGIWRLEDGTLTTAIANPGLPRPATFEIGPGRTVSSWRRC